MIAAYQQFIGEIESADEALTYYLAAADPRFLSQQFQDLFDRPLFLQNRMRDMLVKLASKTESEPLREAILKIDETIERSWKMSQPAKPLTGGT